MKKPKFFLFLIIFLITLLVLRLFYIQVLKYDFYSDLAKRNYLKFIILPAPRGLILDRNNNVLASNKVKYSLYLIPPFEFDERKYKKLSEILNIPYKDLEKKFKKVSPYYPAMLIKSDLNHKEIALLEGNRENLPSFTINMDLYRYYPNNDIASHILGYMGEVSKDELLDEESDYSLGDFVGKWGIEKYYEKFLRGVKGYKSVELFSGNKEYKLLPSKDPKPGNNLVLTIDLELQKLAEEALGDDVGTVIVSDPWTGEILALASSPKFDPNKFIIGFSKEEWQSLITDERNPFHNRAISGLYPPGSIFKLIVALTALEENKVSLKEKFVCTGGLKLGNLYFACWKKEGHGIIDFLNGIAQSCNVVFYNLGLRVGADSISKMAKDFGLDAYTKIDLPGEVKGFIPSPEWKKSTLKESWYPGDTLNMSIGQGYILTTPIEIHLMLSMIATEGYGFKPHLVKKIIDYEGNEVKVFEPEIIRKVNIRKDTWNILKEGMKLVVEKGTGRAAKSEVWEVGGKTGTAQNPHGESHAWFGAVFPLDSPKYVITVFVEHGKSGGAKCAPIAQKIISYLENKEVNKIGKNLH